MKLTFEKIIADIRQKKLAPVYLLHGEEAFFIDEIMNVILNEVLTDQEQEFNQMVFYGKDAQPQNIVSSARQFPMMAEKRVIVLKEAQQMRNLDVIASYIENPVSSTIFVIVYRGKKMDMRTTIGKTCKKNALIFHSQQLYENQVPSWIKSHAKSSKINITTAACSVMTALLGIDLLKIDNELQKLKIAVSDDRTIDVEDVKANIGLSREYNVFELNNALGALDITKTFRIIDIFNTNPTQYPIIYIISTLYGFFTKVLIVSENTRMQDKDLSSLAKVNQYFLKDYRLAARNYSRGKLFEVFEILKDYDLRSKGVNVRTIPQIELIKEMILKIVM